MSRNQLNMFISMLAIPLTTFTATPVLAQQAGAIVDPVTPVSPGRYRVTGTALASDGKAACALALASGRCMFTCGANSPRCEGGTANLAVGQFDLTDLATEPNGTIILQIFVQGNISFTKIINPGGGPETARWSAYNNICCRNSSTGVVYTSTYEVTVDGVTKRSVSDSCTASSTFEGFASTTAGAKSFTARALSSACGNSSGSGTVTMANNSCYRFLLDVESGSLVTKFGSVSCPSSAEANILQEDTGATPMAIFSMFPAATGEVAESPAATYQPLQRQP